MTEPEHHKPEPDVAAETHETRSRAGKGGEDGTYVGRTFNDDALDVGETGAEARAQQE